MGTTKRGKGTKLMQWQTGTVRHSPYLGRAPPARGYARRANARRANIRAEVLLGEAAAELIGDRAYDSDPLDAELECLGIEMIAPHRRRRKQPKT